MVQVIMTGYSSEVVLPVLLHMHWAYIGQVIAKRRHLTRLINVVWIDAAANDIIS